MTEIFEERQTPSTLHITSWEKLVPNLKVGITTRIGGESDSPYDSLNIGLHTDDYDHTVIKNREIVASLLSFPLTNWVTGEQVHDSKIKLVTSEDKGKGAYSHQSALPGIDGLITKDKGILCTTFFADCVPIYFLDPVTEYIGIAHAGWRGTVKKIAKEMVLKFLILGTNINHLRVAIGPCISKDKYEVDHKVIDNIEQPLLEKSTKKIAEQKYLLDLKQLNVEILLQSGVLRNNIDTTHYCTYANHDIFYSFRRDDGKTGRMLGFIGYTRDNSNQ